MVALDHRGSFLRVLNRIGADCGPARRRELKLTVWQGLSSALPRVPEHASAAILIDRGHERIAREAEAAGVRVALALERSGGCTLHPDEAPSLLRRELGALRQAFGKVLVRWHPDDSASRKRRQLGALRELDKVVSDAGTDLLLELLIHPRPNEGIGASSARLWEDSVLPGLQREAAEEILISGISPVAWKMEGHSNAREAARLDALVGSARADASVLILGGGSDIAGLRRAFSCRAGNERFRGFAVGRSIWQEPILALCKREITQTRAEGTIGDNFLAVVDAFESATRARVGQC